MDARLKNVLQEEVKTLSARRYEVLDIIKNFDGFLYLKQVVNALNQLYDLVNKWLYISSKIDNKTIYDKVIGYYNKYESYDKDSYLALFNLEYTRCMRSILRGFDYEQEK